MFQVADACLLGIALWIAHGLRTLATQWNTVLFPPIQPFEAFAPLMAFVVLMGPVILDLRGIYRQALLETRNGFFVRLAQAMFLILVVMALLIYLLKLGELARGVVILFTLLSFGIVSARYFLWARRFQKSPQSDFVPLVLLVAETENVEKARKLIEGQQDVTMKIVGEVQELKNLETQISDWLHRQPIHGVIFSAPHTAFEEIQKAIRVCELEGVEAWVLTDYLHSQISRPNFQDFQGQPVLMFTPREVAIWHLIAKRVLDIVVSFLGLVLFSPLFLGIALVIWLESRTPILFVQDRSGRRGRIFRMYKFRSMISNAAMYQAELDAFNEMKGPVFKIEKDPRVTKFGAFLRRTSLDELPQLWNVLKGEMSLVGPRPLPVYETNRILDWSHRRRLSVKPGLTCLWQISGRNQIRNFEDWAKLDLEYVDHWNFWMDLKILLKTIPVVISGTLIYL
jgi:exopolysaccharide biosynthesis polyprenyl glycosylphosphotransferase